MISIRVSVNMNLDRYLQKSKIIDFDHPSVLAKAKVLARGLMDDKAIAKACFLFVRDDIRHSGDHKDSPTTLRAGEVLEKGTGWCYAKSILLAALLRANSIPAALCYQRLSCSEYVNDIYCLHGLNAVYLKDYGWYRCDARGNKEGVYADFTPPLEKLAFVLKEGEMDIDGLFAEPIPEIIKALSENNTYEKMIANLPDTNRFTSSPLS